MIRQAVKRLPFAVPVLRALRRARTAIPHRPRPVILMYHRIAKDSFDPWGLAVTPGHFADQLRWLSQNRIVLSLPEFAARQRGGDLPDRAVALTFDDAYACTAEAAAPMLRKAQMPATVFLPAELVERGYAYWWHELEHLVLGFAGDSLGVDRHQIRLGDKSANDQDWRPGDRPRTARQRAFHRIWAILRTKSPEDIERSMADLREQTGTGAGAGAKGPMSPGQVHETAAGGLIEFGSHALSHAPLPQLSSSDKAIEIEGSVERCAALSGHRPRTFAYPYGDRDEESERLVERAGFECACTTEQRPVLPGSRLFALPRLAVGDWDARGLARVLGTR